MTRHWVRRGVKVLVIGAVAIGLAGAVTMSLWNWLLPGLFGWPSIGFLQAIGLLVLSRILFGGFGRGGGGGRWRGEWRRRMAERWEKMTPEERETFRAGVRHRCGPMGEPPQAPGTPA